MRKDPSAVVLVMTQLKALPTWQPSFCQYLPFSTSPFRYPLATTGGLVDPSLKILRVNHRAAFVLCRKTKMSPNAMFFEVEYCVMVK
jgi:hypothetical protein